ncbi:exported hypothetical protein [Candidatus Accumulibacter aalborgensis]|uniref:Ice-binding protein C-terminal domain-containing protein n=2 Tax=Candidatus Accumulibacter aalborgensis TaxID=1860102 RepID=A0A1A8Y146_9PROT|nr:exported hypothetical protein [Candidatus Accumulibacter aalborgensis]
MPINNTFCKLLAAVAVSSALAGTAQATVFSGDLYYTYYSGPPNNVDKIGFSYDDTTHVASLGVPTPIASTPGADGIIFAPNGHLLVGGQGSGSVYEVTTGGSTLASQPTGAPSYHLTLDPNNLTVYTSDFGGALKKLSLPIGSGVVTTPITGDETGVTQVAFGTGGAVFYVQGSPNGFGNLGTIDLGTGATSRLYSAVQPAHGLIYDPFTGLMTMFGRGETGTMSAVNGLGLLTSAEVYGVSDFDQGAVDGFGHALVAGSNAITFIDYSVSHDITHPNYVANFFGFDFIDDVAPLVGPGSNPNPTPEPASLALLGLGLAGLAGSRGRKSAR